MKKVILGIVGIVLFLVASAIADSSREFGGPGGEIIFLALPALSSALSSVFEGCKEGIEYTLNR